MAQEHLFPALVARGCPGSAERSPSSPLCAILLGEAEALVPEDRAGTALFSLN